MAPAPAPAPAPAAAAPAPTWKDLITIEGLADAFYLYNFSGANSTTNPVGRQFDEISNSFTLNYAKVGVGLTADKAALRLDLGYGNAGKLINGGDPTDPTDTTEAFVVQQAYASVIPVPGLTLDFGKFVTTAGAEVIETNKNWIYSRSILFFSIPLVHTGLRATYKASDALILQASVVNGWNGNGYSPDDSQKTYGVSINFTAPTGTNAILTGYFGKENGSANNTRVLADLVVAHTMGNLGLNLNVDYIKEGTAIDNFIGIAPMIHYVISDSLNFSVRGEFVKTGVGDLKLYEGTADLGIPMSGHFEARVELRDDYASVDGYFNGKKNQFTGLLGFLAWF